MSLDLCLHVRKAEVDLSSNASLVVRATVNGLTKGTNKQSSSTPVWNEDIHFEVDHVTGDLWVELCSSSFLRQEILGHTFIPLYSIRYSNKQSEGEWHSLDLRTPTELIKTHHKLQFDVHFKLPKNIPAKELELLEKKLNSLHTLLEKEVNTLSQQEDKFYNKALAVPDEAPGTYQYPDEVKKKQSEFATKMSSRSLKTVSFSEDDDGPSKHKMSAKERWQNILDKPAFKKKMKALENTGTKPKTETSSLALLVNHLQGLKKIEQSVEEVGLVSFSETCGAKRMYNRQRSRENVYAVRDSIDEDFRIHVYKRTLRAMIYPAANLHAHQFVEKSFRSPTYCGECENFIYGLARQGVQCQRCGKNLHKKCATSAKNDCFHIRGDNASSIQESHLMAISDVMKDTLKKHRKQFELLRDAFSISETENTTIINEASSNIKDMACKFSAIIKVKVIAAQGLALNADTLERRIYVSVDVGGEKKRTKLFKEHGTPHWNEEFQFECHNLLEPIKIRVWNEKHTTLSKLTHMLTSEGDQFLGQKTIEVLRLGAGSNIWYKLEKRTEQSISGSIQLNLSAIIDGEYLIAPYHTMYSLLHKQLFLHCHIRQQIGLVPTSQDSKDMPVFLPDKAQQIIDEFAMRYVVEPIYRAMVHFELLVNHSSLPECFKMMNNVLIHIKHRMFMLSAEENAVRGIGLQMLMAEIFDASNFDRDKFSSLLEKLLGLLRVNLQSYREVYPVSNKDMLKELTDTCQLLKTVLEFQMQVIGMEAKYTVKQLSSIIEGAMKESVKTTFDVILQDLVPENYQGHPALDKSKPPYQFYYDLLRIMSSVVFEDKTVYQPLIKSFCDFNLEVISTFQLWDEFKVTIQDLFQVEDNLNVFPPIEAIHLMMTIKKYYEEKVHKFRESTAPPDYPFWFEPAVKYWIQDFQQGALNFVKNGWEHDKGNHFQPDQDQTFSSSAYDMFVYFHKGQEVTHGLDGGVLILRHTYSASYAKIVKSLIMHYIDLVSVEITNSRGDLDVMCMLLNNLQFIRFGTQSLFEAMGGKEDSGEECTDELNDLQTILGKQLNSWCPFVINCEKNSIWATMRQLQDDIIKLKAQGPSNREDAKAMIEPVLDALFFRAKTIGKVSEKNTILPKLIKELWYIVMEGLQLMLLPKTPALTSVKEQELVFKSVHYNQRQCAIMDHVIDQLKDFFLDDNVGVKESTLDRNVKQMKAITKLYRQPTEGLIMEVLKHAGGNVEADSHETFGQVSLEMNLSRRPASGGVDGTIRVISADNIQPFQHSHLSSYKVHVELSFIFPNCQNFGKFRFITSPGTTTEFNQTFKFTLPPTEMCEVQVAVKHKPLMGTEQVLGVGSVPFETIHRSKFYTVDLCHSFVFNERARAFLTILALRHNDEVARDFVILKTLQRPEGSS